MLVPALAALLVGLLVGALAVWLATRGQGALARAQGEAERATLLERLRGREGELADVRRRLEEERRRAEGLQAELGRLEVRLSAHAAQAAEERRASEEKLQLLTRAREELERAFQALSADALQRNSQAFLELAQLQLQRFQEGARGELLQRQGAIEALVGPLKESLERVDGHVQALESARATAYGSLSQQLAQLSQAQEGLQRETASLVGALKAPTARGRWGEIQLKRVVEMAGMLECCDFVQQEALQGGKLRPDLVVRLPGDKRVIVDAKAPLQAYLEALEARDEATRRQKLQEHALQLRSHLKQLGDKAYWDALEATPEFVVMFLPGETFFSAALEQDPALIEAGVERQVILATPTTLIALLRAVSYGWRQETVAQNAREVRELGRGLYDRLRTLARHVTDAGKGLERALEAHNALVGSLEARVLPQARRLKDLGAGGGEDIPPLPGVDGGPRPVRAGELEEGPERLVALEGGQG